jgi:SNF2 family DNA or RNA helicase
MQAVDRAHRIGQQKLVKVHRILVENTVEDRIIDLQNRKRKFVEAALDEKASQGLGRLGRQELMYLFNGGAELGGPVAAVAGPNTDDSLQPGLSD